MNHNLESQNLYPLSNYSTVENSEGGLNIGEIKNIIFRKLPLIAGCTIAITSLTFLKVTITPQKYVASFELLEPLNIETKVTSTNEESRETREEITSVKLNDVQLKILKSPRLISRVVQSLKKKYPEINYQELTEGLTINIITDSQEDSESQNILEVTYENSDKQKVASVINVLTKVYIDYSAEKRLSGVKRGIAFLDQQIPKAYSEVSIIEKQIKTLRSKHNFIKPDISLEPLTIRSKNLTQESNQISIKLPELRLMAKRLEQELKTQPAKSDIAVKLATPQYLELLKNLRQIDIEIARKSAVFSDNSIEIQALKQEKQQIAFLLQETGEEITRKLDNEIKILENRQQKIVVETDNLKSQLEGWSSVSSDYNNLLQKLTLANNKLNEFTLQKDTLLIEAAQQEAPWQLLTPATEPETKNMGMINYLLLGSTLGLLVGLGAALVLDKHQNIIYTSAKVEEITSLPILATIPYTRKYKLLSSFKQINLRDSFKQLPSQEPNLGIQQSFSELTAFSIEVFRSFAANLGFFSFNSNLEDLGNDTNIKSLVITSAISREGKSTVALNLARACASMGKKTLLVDTDLRSDDRLTKYLGLESERGLSNILNQNNNNINFGLDDINIKQLPLEENLFFITSGYGNILPDLHTDLESIQQDPSRLLASAKMHFLMEKLKTEFDVIIYDLCAIVGFADVSLLAGQTDGIVLVTGIGKIQTIELTEALYQLRLCKAPILGLAINKVINNS
jgi:polysaccharide biosynthesis transport protein